MPSRKAPRSIATLIVWVAIALLVVAVLSATCILLLLGRPFQLISNSSSATAFSKDGSTYGSGMSENQRLQAAAGEKLLLTPARDDLQPDRVDPAGTAIETASVRDSQTSSGEGREGDTDSTILNGNEGSGGVEGLASESAGSSDGEPSDGIPDDTPGDSSTLSGTSNADEGLDGRVVQKGGRKESEKVARWRVDANEARRVRGVI